MPDNRILCAGIVVASLLFLLRLTLAKHSHLPLNVHRLSGFGFGGCNGILAYAEIDSVCIGLVLKVSVLGCLWHEQQLGKSLRVLYTINIILSLLSLRSAFTHVQPKNTFEL